MDISSQELIKLANPQLHDLLFDNLSLNYSIIDVNRNYVPRNNANYQNISQKLLNAKDIDPVLKPVLIAHSSLAIWLPLGLIGF